MRLARSSLRLLQLPAVERYDGCLILSLLLVVTSGPEDWWSKLLVWGLALPMIVAKELRWNSLLWYLIAATILGNSFYNWATADNHKYLMAYWAVAVGSSLLVASNRRLDALAFNGRWLLGLAMAFAVVWKMSSAEYLSGDFFLFTFLTDPRFYGFVAFLTDLTQEQMHENTARLALLREGFLDNILVQSQTLYCTPRVRTLAIIATWWTIGIEVLVALLFLVPLSARYLWARHASIIVFAITTYIVAPVEGFGCLLMIMGAAQCLRGWDRAFLGYCGLFVAIRVLPFVSGPLWDFLTSAA